MSATAVAITYGSPYGAPELKGLAQKFLLRATIFAALAHFLAIGGVKVWEAYTAREEAARPIKFQRFTIAPPPPSLTKTPPIPVSVARTIVPPSMGAPVPVPDARAPVTQTVPTQEEIRSFSPTQEVLGGSDQIIIAAPQEDEMPKIGEFVYYEEGPQMISMPKTVYPDLAREAGIEGTVIVNALVGKNGSVMKTEVTKSVTMLDDAAVAAVAKSTWKPAQNNNKPVPVWVAVPMKFSLSN